MHKNFRWWRRKKSTPGPARPRAATRRAVPSTRGGTGRDARERDRMVEKTFRSILALDARDARRDRDRGRVVRSQSRRASDVAYKMTHRRVHSRRASMASRVASRRARRARIEKVFLHAFHRVRPRWHPRDGSRDVDDRSIPRIHLFDSRPFDSLALLADTACDMNRHTHANRRTFYHRSPIWCSYS
jgi:hypothetical protein